jgi:lambda family phage minor tail protein L
MINAPVTHLEEAHKLEADARVDLWEVHLKGEAAGTIVRFWNGPVRTWQGNQYEGLACQLEGEATGTDGQNNRPTLTVANPLKIFGTFAADGYFDLATVIRKRVLQTHFTTDVNQCETRVWICGRPSGVLAQVLRLELRSPTDMPNFKTPRRVFAPPTYPFVVT